MGAPNHTHNHGYNDFTLSQGKSQELKRNDSYPIQPWFKTNGINALGATEKSARVKQQYFDTHL
jgi:hypothetical protein